MKLPIPFLNNKKDDSGYYLALILDDERANSVILKESSGKIKIVGKHSEHFTVPLETISQDELIKIVDRTISKAEEVLPPNIETHKTVFGIKENWVEKESKKIKKEYLAKLKKVCDALDLSPIGFMVISEAIANLLQIEEGVPLSAILIEIGRKTIHLTSFRGGKITESLQSHLSEDVPATVDTLLKSFTAPVLPTRIILFHAKEVSHLTQKFTRHEWSKGLPFLHLPQIVALPEDFDARAVAYGAANQMGFEIIDTGEKIPLQAEAVTAKEDFEMVNTEDLPKPPASKHKTHENFGFVPDEDVAAQKVTINEEPIKENTLTIDPKDNFPLEVSREISDAPLDKYNDSSEETSKQNKKSILSSISPLFAAIRLPKPHFIMSLLTKNKNIKLPLIVFGVIVILLVGISVFYFNNTTANVTLSVKPNVVTKQENITFSSTSSNDFSKKIIAAKSISTNIDGEVVVQATGKKDTGSKAKGQVTIFNSSDDSQSLSSGTEIKSSNGPIFTLDKDINIASASGDIFTGTKPGTAQVAVTAKEIGTESNLPSNTKFSVGGNSGLAARNDSAFTGGTKKTITVVSKEDQAKLRSELAKSLEKKAQEEMSKKNGPKETVLPGFVNVTLDNAKFDKAIDDEAKQVKLVADVKFEGMSYLNSDLEDFETALLKESYTQDISFAKEGLKNELSQVKAKDDNEITARILITAGLLPKIDKNEVINKLKNKSPKDAKEILSTIPQVAENDIKYSPNISILASIFKRLPQKIDVTVKSE